VPRPRTAPCPGDVVVGRQLRDRAHRVGTHTAAAARGVARPRGIRPAADTNPIGFGLPSADGPVVFDKGTSAFILTDAAYRERMGQLLPEGVAIDSAGRLTHAIRRLPGRGAILPFGGYKGFGLAFIVQAFGVLARSALDPEMDDGYFSITLCKF
jgi:LDH2 family malate/lactate/ureidoglycolate dehydrogenase